MEIKTIIILIVLALAAAFILVGLWASAQKHPNCWMLRAHDWDDDNFGGPRERVWSDKERTEYRRDRERRKLRVVQ